MRVLSIFAAGLFVIGCGLGDTDSTQGAASVTPPTFELGNPSCSDVFGPDAIELKVEPPQNGTFPVGDGINEVTVANSDGIYFDWSATLGMDGVIVKGGPNASIYTYDPEAMDDKGLHAPINPNTGKPYGLSHISFCFDYEVVVTKTAETSFDRTYDWTVTKIADKTSVTLAANQTLPVVYTVTVNSDGHVDSNFAVQGTIEVFNPAPFDATVTGVEDVITGGLTDIPVPVSCPVQFPYTLASGKTLTCAYTAVLPDGINRTNEATATTTGKVGEGSTTVPVDFVAAQINAVDECVTVEDDMAGSLGQVCAWDTLPAFITYTYYIGPFEECGIHQHVNTVTITPNDSGTAESAQATVTVAVPCDVGCTLTPGYWKTHSKAGPAPFDPVWQDFGGAQQKFFLSGQSYYEVLWTAPKKGNAYYILAHAYIAAELNKLAGASFDDAQAAFDDATQLFQVYTPDQVVADKQLKALFTPLATTLDDFNNGLIGPGHCDE